MRGPRTLRARLAFVSAVSLVAAMTGCTESADDVEVSQHFDSVVDRASGAITFPYETFYPNAEESAVLTTAMTLARTQCAADLGVEWRSSPHTGYSTLYESSIFFGVWTEDQASRFAFFPPSTQADLVANGLIAEAGDVQIGTPEQPDMSDRRAIADHNSSLTDDELATASSCDDDPDVQRFDIGQYFQGSWNAELRSAMNAFESDERVVEMQNSLRACYEQHGLTSAEDSTDPVGARYDRIDEEQIGLALAVVDCKTSLDYVPTMAAVMADLQSPVIARYESELREERERVDAALDAARSLIAQTQDASA